MDADMTSDEFVTYLRRQGSHRPAPVNQPALPAWDASDQYGTVWTVPPPEWQPPAPFTDPVFLRTDFNGITLDMSKWPGLTIPVLVGANTTPVNMLMSPMLILYPREVQDAWLTEACWRGYNDIVIAPDGWNLTANGFMPTPQNIVAWAQYCQTWGFRIVLWRSLPTSPDPIYRAMLAAHCISFYVVGEEIDGKIIAEQLPPILDQALADCGDGIPIGVHFTANYPASGFPADTFLTDWSPYNGRVHLCFQAAFNDSAGRQGAMLYYARQRVQLGLVGDGSYSNPAPDSRVILFEAMAEAQLYGRCDELDGKLRILEMSYAPHGLPGISMNWGYANGGSQHDGTLL